MAYSNSDLVTYTKVSPNRNSPRNHSIDTITIHCMAAQWTAKQCVDYFAKSSTGASSNYCVGKDGSIGLSVPEKDRSWCSSSASNDNRAITIEVASDSTHPYKVTSKAYNALIELLVDICKRNNIKELKWKADKSLVGKVSEQNMTVHRWFSNKACPGDYLYSRHSAIANSVNERLGSSGGSTSTPSNNEEYIWDYFKDKIGNEYGVAGLMGNLYCESGLHPDRVQGDIPYSSYSQEYTSKVDNGSVSENDFVHNGPNGGGYGLAQWTYYSRKQALYNMYKQGGYSSIGSIELACDYLWYELQHEFSGVMSVLKSATNVRVASNKVLHDFERPADQSTAVENSRNEYCVYFYNKYALNDGTGGSGAISPDDSNNTDYEGIVHKNKLGLLLIAMATEDF